jgi:DNA-binding NarL/FixJ family response regulator
VSRIRILLVEMAEMLNEIVRATISTEPDMTIVDGSGRGDDDIAAYTRRRRIDIVIYPAGNADFAGDKLVAMLKANPRLALLAIDGLRDEGTLHHLVPAHDAIDRLAHSSLTAAIRAGATLRKP